MQEHDDAVETLAELALNLRSAWNHSADELWAQIDPELWAATSNPWIVVQNTSPARLRELAASPDFARRLAAVHDRVNQSLAAAAWFQRAHANSALGTVAYFSMEFALAESLPIYSGGLGNVAGDQLKAASDLGVPVVGVGLLYQQGYFRQIITPDGDQEALYPYNDPHLLPVSPVRSANGDVLRLAVGLPGQNVWLRAWQARVGAYHALLARRQRSRQLAAHSRNHDRAVRRWRLASPEAGDSSGNRWLAPAPRDRPFTGRLPPQRGTRGFRGARTRGHLHEGRAGSHSTSRWRSPAPETCSRRTRPSPPDSTASAPEIMRRFFGTYAEERLGISLDRLMALGRAEPRRSRRTIQHGVPRAPRQRRGERREPPARRGQPPDLPAALSALAAERGPHRARHERRPHAVLGFARGRRAVDEGVRADAVAGHSGRGREGPPLDRRRGAMGDAPGKPAAPGRVRSRACRPAGRRRRRRRRCIRGEARSRGADARFRAAIRRRTSARPCSSPTRSGCWRS